MSSATAHSTLPPAVKPPRGQVPVERLCEYCTAKCCRYFALPIETPSERRDFDYIRWFLMHDRASVFVDGETWYLLVQTPCEHLRTDNRCGIYDRRPQICRDYSTADCEYEDHAVYDRYFEIADQVEEYIEALFGREDGSIRSPRPPLLPIIS